MARKTVSKTAQARPAAQRVVKAKPATPRSAIEAEPAVTAEPTIAAVPAITAELVAVAETAATEISEIQEGNAEMTYEATQAVADRVQALFGDVNERARTAIEKNAKIVEELTELTRGNVEALVVSSKVAARGVEALGQEAAEYSRKSFEEASSALRSFAEVKSPTDFFRLQGEFAKTQFDSIVSESSKLSEAVIKLASDVIEPISTRYSVAAEKVKNVVAA